MNIEMKKEADGIIHQLRVSGVALKPGAILTLSNNEPIFAAAEGEWKVIRAKGNRAILVRPTVEKLE